MGVGDVVVVEQGRCVESRPPAGRVDPLCMWRPPAITAQLYDDASTFAACHARSLAQVIQYLIRARYLLAGPNAIRENGIGLYVRVCRDTTLPASGTFVLLTPLQSGHGYLCNTRA